MNSPFHSPQKLIGIFALFIGVILMILVYLGYSGEELATHQAPQVDATMEIKLHAALGHLWFEEILSGDRNEQIENVWNYLEQADWYAQALLVGGSNEKGNFYPLTDPKMRANIFAVKEKLAKFRRIAEKRYQNFQTSQPGSEIDQRFDQVFEDFMATADRTETLVQRKIETELITYNRLSNALVGLATLFSLVFGVILYRLARQRERYLGVIEEANLEIRQQHQLLETQAHFDGVTGLPNRILFTDRLDQGLARAERNGGAVVLLFIDLDRFKQVNDYHGHLVGDQLLKAVGGRLHEAVRHGDTVARLSGDEFTVILPDVPTQEGAVQAAQAVSGKIMELLQKPFDLKGTVAEISASIGIAVYPRDGRTVEDLWRHSDQAMLDAKKKGKNRVQFHSMELSNQAREIRQVEEELRCALEREQFRLFFQPQWDLETGALVGGETLVRWQHPTKGLLAPGSFIPIAEKSGLIDRLDLWVMQTAFQRYSAWKMTGAGHGKLSINISAKQFSQRGFVKAVRESLAQNHLLGKEFDLELELTESVFIEDTRRTQRTLKALKELGLKIALDDFGSGYTSMAYLRSFAADTFKIDRSFVQTIHSDDRSNAILKSMVELGRNLGMRVVAEGVETEEQEAFVRSAGCHLAQGFKLACPMPEGDYLRLLDRSEAPKLVQEPA